MWQSLLLVGGGAALGASARWVLGVWLNPLFGHLAFGTLIANYTGCFIIGVCTACFWQFPQLSAAVKLFMITGFLGGLTTFSSFSAEVVENVLQGKIGWAFAIMNLHLLGCLVFTFLGIFLTALCWK
ncbi:fluoride ion transporter CrcB [Actinobacillus succinogenes]|uniref:Fluoride-specific ion channel FluC n=1 Tax=Actinobacillus succinogenes (strain ATCC 55618 / DSM 22257 / CCUG 43843 / 130Z) TaxID=339671 RepID=A6VLE2_ACTSZ|nr:fluoride efflux transporter CrcB [Actinobacillus succinogenes]ABR73789.1 CrcB protein [Actinobacillus succinogenes 130Z]PHI39755.1 fluoride ion transporter CrcB [Actinobacillus succinogenes]